MVAVPTFNNDVDVSLFQFRLSLNSGVPFEYNDLTGAGTLYLTPFNGNALSLYTSSVWRRYTSSQLQITLSALQPFLPYDVFVYDNSGTLTLELVAWTSPGSGSITGATNATPISITSTSHGLSTNDLVYISGVGGNTAANCATGVPWRITNTGTNTFTLQTLAAANVAGSGAYTSGGTWYKVAPVSSRVTAITTQDGIAVKSGSTNKRLAGTICTTSASTCEDSNGKRFCANYYNLRLKPLFFSSSSSHSYNGNYRAWNNDYANRGWFVLSDLQDIFLPITAQNTPSSTSISASVAISLDAPANANDYTYQPGSAADARRVAIVSSVYNPGLHYAAITESTFSGGSATFSATTMNGTVLT